MSVHHQYKAVNSKQKEPRPPASTHGCVWLVHLRAVGVAPVATSKRRVPCGLMMRMQQSLQAMTGTQSGTPGSCSSCEQNRSAASAKSGRQKPGTCNGYAMGPLALPDMVEVPAQQSSQKLQSNCFFRQVLYHMQKLMFPDEVDQCMSHTY
jgi:hypothetical protein